MGLLYFLPDVVDPHLQMFLGYSAYWKPNSGVVGLAYGGVQFPYFFWSEGHAWRSIFFRADLYGLNHAFSVGFVNSEATTGYAGDDVHEMV